MLEYKGYFGTVEADDGVFAGRVSGLRGVITFEGATFAEIEQAFRDSIDDYLAFCAARGEPPDRPYSGKIPLRVSPETHRRAATLARGERDLARSEEHTSELQSQFHLVCRLLLEKKKQKNTTSLDLKKKNKEKQ